MTRRLCARLVLLLAVALAALTVTGAAAAAAPTYVSGAGMIGGAGFDWLWPGHVLTAQAGVWNGEPDSFSYRWSRGGTFLGAGPQYTVTNADVGSQIMLSITGSKGADSSQPVDVLSYTVRWPLPESTRPAAIKGTVVAGATVTADPGDWRLTNPAQPGPISFTYWWGLEGIGGPTLSTGTTATLPADSAGKNLELYIFWSSPGSSLPDEPVMLNATVGATPRPGPEMVNSTTNISAGQTISGTVHWTVNASGTAYRTSFYNDNQFIRDAVGTGNNWAIDLDTTKYTNGVHQLGYDIYNQAGERVFIGKHIQVTITNTTATPPPPIPPSGGGGSGGSGGSSPSTPPAQTPPATVPQPTPPKLKPPLSKGGTLKLLIGGFAQTAARRGDQFAVAMFVIRSDNGKQITAGKVTCSLSGMRLVWHGWYHKAAGCRWAIPANAKLGRVTGSLSVTAKGLTVKRKFSTNVKRERVAV